MISLVLSPVIWHIIYKICFDFDSNTRPLITTRQIARHDEPVKSIEADALWHTNLLFSEHFIDTSKINRKTDKLVSLNTTAIEPKISSLRIPDLTKIKAFHQLSESRLAIIPSTGSCLHIFKRSFSGLEIVSVIGSCSTAGFRDGPDPLFRDISQVIQVNFQNETLYVIDQSHALIRQVHLTTNYTKSILQNNNTFNNKPTAHIYWHIHQMQSSAKIYILLRNANLDTLVSHIAIHYTDITSRWKNWLFLTHGVHTAYPLTTTVMGHHIVNSRME